MGRGGVLVVAAVALGLAGCQTDGGPGTTQAAQEPPPTNYRAQVTDRVKKSFFDPYSIRDASISQPFIQNAAFDGITPIPHQGWMVCVRANAKNRMGGYIGQKATGYMFKGGQILDLDFNSPFCEPARYEPFPEIEEGYKPAAAQPAKKRG